MTKRATRKPSKTDIADAVIQDIELTVEQVEEGTKAAAESARRALRKIVKPKEMAPGSEPVVQDRRFKVSGK